MWLWLSLITAVFWGLGGVLLKRGVSELSVRVVYTLNFLAFTGLWLLYFLFVGGFEFNLIAFFLAMLPGLGFLYQLVAYQKVDVSLLASIGSIHPAVTAILAVSLIGEKLSILQAGMIFGVILGAVVMSWPGKIKVKCFCWVWWGLSFGFIAGLVNFISKMGINMVGALSYSLMNSIWFMVYCLGWFIFGGKQKEMIKEVKSKEGKRAAVGTIIFNIGGVAFFLAMGLGKVSLVMPVVNLYVPLLLIIAAFYLKEKMTLRQKLGAGVVVSSVVVLSMVS